MQTVILHCGPHNQFHLGQSSLEDSYGHIHSDTLFSAMVSVYNLMFPSRVNEFIEEFRQGKIRISSAFHCLQHGQDDYLFFLPKPMRYHQGGGNKQKQIKGIQFVSEGVWNAAPPTDRLRSRAFTLLGSQHLITKHEAEQLGFTPRQLTAHSSLKDMKLVEDIMYPKVRVHEQGQLGVFYHQKNIQLQALETQQGSMKTHFYFLLNHQLKGEALQRLKACIRMLADEGIGGERSTGCGAFRSVSFQELNRLPFTSAEADPSSLMEASTDGKKFYCALSLISPASATEAQAIKQYQLVLRGGGALGKVGNQELHRRQVRMVAAGALLSKPIDGSIVDVSPRSDQSILRNGRAFLMPFTYAN